jgi:SAM-dependent methyltransferase
MSPRAGLWWHADREIAAAARYVRASGKWLGGLGVGRDSVSGDGRLLRAWPASEPPALVDAFESALGLNGTGRLLDVGCGPDTIALRIAHLFEEVVGVDTDAGLIEEARCLSLELG